MAPQRPTTPLLRRSSFSASASRRPPQMLAADEDFKISPMMGELESGFRDLAVGMEGLERNVRELGELTGRINAFNESFASFLYGMKVNAYTTTFVEAPTAHSFALAPIFQQRRQQPQRSMASVQPLRSQTPAGETTVMESRTGVEETFISDQGQISRVESSIPVPSKGGSSTNSKGKIGKKALLNFTSQVIDTLPIMYREQQSHRLEMEAVLEELRLQPEGISAEQISKHRTRITMNRIRLALNQLVQTKHVVKSNQGGLVIFSLNPLKHSF
ncbi:hypothetical protein BT69DRAFT_1358872 [Atractiella rhizophila]|nr:hypothetical protein BT69DRAFT_1358872 [Atractiella rhizophila]